MFDPASYPRQEGAYFSPPRAHHIFMFHPYPCCAYGNNLPGVEQTVSVRPVKHRWRWPKAESSEGMCSIQHAQGIARVVALDLSAHRLSQLFALPVPLSKIHPSVSQREHMESSCGKGGGFAEPLSVHFEPLSRTAGHNIFSRLNSIAVPKGHRVSRNA